MEREGPSLFSLEDEQMCTRRFSPADAANDYLNGLRDYPTWERPPLLQITFMIISLELNCKQLGGLEAGNQTNDADLWR